MCLLHKTGSVAGAAGPRRAANSGACTRRAGRRRGTAAGFTAENLAAMERGLAGADLSGFLRQRPVCRLGPADAGPEIA